MPFPPTDAAALYSDHHGWLQRWLKFRLNNAYDAADLAHDTFVRVLARPRQHPHEGIVGQVGRVIGVVQAELQPPLQPPVVVAVQRGGVSGRKRHGIDITLIGISIIIT